MKGVTVFLRFKKPDVPTADKADVGTQYRSTIYTTTDEQARVAAATRDAFAPVVKAAGRGEITTEIKPLGSYFYAEDYHQQYLSSDKTPTSTATTARKPDITRSP